MSLFGNGYHILDIKCTIRFENYWVGDIRKEIWPLRMILLYMFYGVCMLREHGTGVKDGKGLEPYERWRGRSEWTRSSGSNL